MAKKLSIYINIAPRRTTRHALVDNFLYLRWMVLFLESNLQRHLQLCELVRFFRHKCFFLIFILIMRPRLYLHFLQSVTICQKTEEVLFTTRHVNGQWRAVRAIKVFGGSPYGCYAFEVICKQRYFCFAFSVEDSRLQCLRFLSQGIHWKLPQRSHPTNRIRTII